VLELTTTTTDEGLRAYGRPDKARRHARRAQGRIGPNALGLAHPTRMRSTACAAALIRQRERLGHKVTSHRGGGR
jgi:hypothetical protein